MKKIAVCILFFVTLGKEFTQGQNIDSLKLNFARKNVTLDTNRVNELIRMAALYFFSLPDSSLHFSQEAVELAHELNFIKGEIEALQRRGEVHGFLGDFPKALESQFLALELAQSNKRKMQEATSLGFIGVIYSRLNEHRQALHYFFAAKAFYDQLRLRTLVAFNLSNIGAAYDGLGLQDSALFFLEKAWVLARDSDSENLKVLTLHRLGHVRAGLGDYDEAFANFRTALNGARKVNDRVNSSMVLLLMAQLQLKLNQKDSCLYYARLAFSDAKGVSRRPQMLEAANLIVSITREKNMQDSLIYYQDIVLAMKDTLFGADKFKQLQVLALLEQQRKLDIIRDQDQFRNRSRLLGLSGILVFVLAIAFILYKNYRQKNKVNLILEKQKVSLERTLNDLKAAQSQLIQSEKMASLGELTAGIAHEIQNPLNFVNNFSEVNRELLVEMKEKITDGNLEDASKLANDIINNEEKINNHGKRADAIVKGMLQHSRSNSGIKEPTDINALCGEYFRLAYHGLRAKDNLFSATMKTDFDETLGKINVIPQDIGRVILNLITNAFYAVSEKAKRMTDYEPVVTLSTRREGDKVLIVVKDNGDGIHQNIVDKIFQPFFTTKPTGTGTGLGLSLSYDIVKTHGGNLSVETKEGEGSEFVIQIQIV